MTALSIVIPAHDEGPLVRATLEHLLDGTTPGEFEVVVVANGCRDDTVAQAASVRGVHVVEIHTASKTAALNAGDAAARVFPRVYLDADVAISAGTLRALADVLSACAEPRAAAPLMRVDSAASTWPVRAYYRVWELSDYRSEGHIGSGVYAVNQSGRARWGLFPDVIADDRFVQQRFVPGERAGLGERTFTVRASRDMKTHVLRGARIERGNRELPDELQLATQVSAARRYSHLLGRVAIRPARWPDLPFYLYGFGAAKLRARARRTGRIDWARDESLRKAARA